MMSNDRAALLSRACRLRWPGRRLRGLADMLGRPKSTVAEWLSGRRNMPPELIAIVAADFRQYGGRCIELGAELAFSAEKGIRHPVHKKNRNSPW
jgi:hypothetical protein